MIWDHTIHNSINSSCYDTAKDGNIISANKILRNVDNNAKTGKAHKSSAKWQVMDSYNNGHEIV